MSVVILGGNECMERRYKDLCKSYQCQSKIFTKPAGGLREDLRLTLIALAKVLIAAFHTFVAAQNHNTHKLVLSV